jgi:hypothetical protein
MLAIPSNPQLLLNSSNANGLLSGVLVSQKREPKHIDNVIRNLLGFFAWHQPLKVDSYLHCQQHRSRHS